MTPSAALGGTLAGKCVCDEDADCGAGFWCDRGADTRQNSCKAKLNRGAVGGTVGDSKVGHRCQSGHCKVSGLSTKLTGRWAGARVLPSTAILPWCYPGPAFEGAIERAGLGKTQQKGHFINGQVPFP